jgi:hypothetical protein
MSDHAATPSVDLIRWAFTINPVHRAAIESHLAELGLDITVREGSHFFVSWDEPEADADIDAVVEELWAINGAPFEVIQEEYHRTNVLALHHDEHNASDAA